MSSPNTPFGVDSSNTNLQTPKIPFHPGPPLSHELGVMFGFIAIFILAVLVYYYSWRIVNEIEAKREWKRRVRLAGMGIGDVSKRSVMGDTDDDKRRILGGPGWSDKWRNSAVVKEKEKGEKVGWWGKWFGGMVMSTGPMHGGGELP
ncbi:MAG: hypothetical protein L6R37_006507 [Teloschistes peruensis]|nr:MAG: hypothetical protein L6R37_006507 [Teloschistes peruensis]